MKYYKVHVRYSETQGFQVLYKTTDNFFTGPNEDDLISHAVNIGLIEPDDIEHVDCATEITEKEYEAEQSGK